MRQNSLTAEVNQLVGVVYNELGQRSTLTQGTSKTVSYGYDSLYRLSSLGIDLASASADLNLTFGYNAAGQITSRTADNDLYAQAAPGGQIAGTYTPDVLNRYTKVAGVNQSYDPKGNLTGDGTNSFTYDNENRLTKIGSATTLTYDPADRLSRKAGSSDDIRYVYDGGDLIEEYDASTGNVLRKYVHGPGADEPVVWYEGADLTDRRWMTADERGSVIASTTAPGGVMNINTYDEYGSPGPGNIGRFGYTGQTWLAEGGVYNYKARAYSPKIGRFMQTDPIGYADNMNAYAYVGNDPANLTDPSGLVGEIVVTGTRRKPPAPSENTLEFINGRNSSMAQNGDTAEVGVGEVTVTGHRIHRQATMMFIGGANSRLYTVGRWAGLSDKTTGCVMQTVKENGAALLLDGVGFGATFIPAGKLAVDLGALAIGGHRLQTAPTMEIYEALASA